MKRYEKIILVIFFLLLGTKLLHSVNENGLHEKNGLFFLADWLLSSSYLIGGYWLFNRGNKRIILPIIAGIAFSISIFYFPFLIEINNKDYYHYLPIANGLLFIGTGIYLFKKRKSEVDLSDVRLIFIRSLIILIIASFFTYTPLSYRPLRKVLSLLNNDDKDLQNNLRMFDNIEDYNEAMKNENYDKAIEFSLKANKAGKSWLGLSDTINVLKTIQNNSDSLSNKNEDQSTWAIKNLSEIGGTYEYVYNAYAHKADDEYGNKKYEDALINYQNADNYLNEYLIACNQQSEYWREERSWSFRNIADCYVYLKNYDIADSLLADAIKNYRAVKDTEDIGLAKLYKRLANTLSKQGLYDYSNDIYHISNSILKNDTLNEDNRKELVSNYNELTANYLQQDSIGNAMFFIHEALNFSDDKNNEYYIQTMAYYGACYYKLNDYKKADSLFKYCLQYYHGKEKENLEAVLVCDFSLGEVSIALAKYDDARKYLLQGMDIITSNFGSNSDQYANFLQTLAYLNKLVGDYNIAEQQYNTVINIYNSESERKKLAEALSELSAVEISLSKLNTAKEYSDSSLSIASNFLSLTITPSAGNLLNQTAYTNYCVGLYKSSDTLYKKVIKINNNYGLENNSTTGIALNGLGLVETAKRNYLKADSLFSLSLELHQNIFSDNNPLTAIVYLNYGILCIQEGKLQDAEDKINKALTIDQQFFKSDHDIFGDIFVALGDLAKKKGQSDVAKDYYQRALSIYKNKFDEGNLKVITTERKIK